MENIHKIYRIERNEDIISILPPSKKFQDSEIYQVIKDVKDTLGVISDLNSEYSKIEFIHSLFDLIIWTNPKFLAYKLFEKILRKFLEEALEYLKSSITDIIKEFLLNEFMDLFLNDYCHFGDLYVLNRKSDEFYHCKDFYNQETYSNYCRNWGFEFSEILNYFLRI